MSTAAILVSIPHRYAKNEGVDAFHDNWNNVSIPHRYAKNPSSLDASKGWRKVSIPHRYAKNVCLPWQTSQHQRVSIPHRYAKNAIAKGILSYLGMFQFLIGTLKTKLPKRSVSV